MKQIALIAGVAAFSILSGCASTNITSFTDPDYRATHFSRILVVANVADLEWRNRIESRLVQELTKQGAFAIKGIELFPPTRDLDDEEKINRLLHNRIDSYITIDVGETGTQEVYIPQTSSTTKTTGSVNVTGSSATYREKSRTTTSGGYTVSKPWAKFTTKLFDVSSGVNAWVATAFTGGNAYANFNTVVNSFCDKIVQQLLRDGLVVKVTPK